MPHARLDLHDPCGRDLGRGRIWDAGDSSVFSKSLAISAIWKIILENHTGKSYWNICGISFMLLDVKVQFSQRTPKRFLIVSR